MSSLSSPNSNDNGSETEWSQGFLPDNDPATHFPPQSPYALLDEIGQNLPSLLIDLDFRDKIRRIHFPLWDRDREETDVNNLSLMRLYYVRMGFIASAYVNQVGQAPVALLPNNLAKPLCHICSLLDRPPILSYDGYALYNWKRFDKEKPVELGNIDTLQNFVHLYDEHWFILIHIDIEIKAARQIQAIFQIRNNTDNEDRINEALKIILVALKEQVTILKRIPDHMDASLYFHAFRPYIRFFENVRYEGESQEPLSQRGETGAQSSIIPALVSLMKIPHQATALMNHLVDMRNYMPKKHRNLLTMIEGMPNIKTLADANLFDQILETMAQFREIHYGWAKSYIDEHVSDPRGTGGTPFMQWLKQLIDETRAHKNQL